MVTPEEGIHDQLAELFVGGRNGQRYARDVERPGDEAEFEDCGGAAEPEHAAAVDLPVDVLLVGQVPARRALWIRQYAAMLAARSGGSIGVVRFGGGSIRVERISSQAVSPLERRPASLEEAVDQLRTHCDRVILAGDEGRQLELAAMADVDRVCMLTAAHDTAVVHAYRLLKSLAASIEASGASAVVSVVGADASRREGAFGRMHAAASRFLDIDIRRGPAIAEDGSCFSEDLFAGADAGGAEDVLRGLRGTLEGVLSTTKSRESAGGSGVQAMSATPDEPAAAASAVGASEPGETDDHDRASGLLRWLDEVEPLGFGCPDAPAVELGVDGEGAAHAIALASDASQLQTTVRWWRRHVDLVMRADGRVSPGELVGHVLSEDFQTAVAFSTSGYHALWLTEGLCEDGWDTVAVPMPGS